MFPHLRNYSINHLITHFSKLLVVLAFPISDHIMPLSFNTDLLNALLLAIVPFIRGTGVFILLAAFIFPELLSLMKLNFHSLNSILIPLLKIPPINLLFYLHQFLIFPPLIKDLHLFQVLTLPSILLIPPPNLTHLIPLLLQ